MFFSGFIKTAKVHKMKATPAKHGGKNGRKVYKLDDHDGAKWTCTCPDYIYRKAAIGGECKHIKAQKMGKKAWEVK